MRARAHYTGESDPAQAGRSVQAHTYSEPSQSRSEPSQSRSEPSQSRFELPLTNLVAALALAFTGPGVYALDPVLGIALPEPITLWGGLGLIIVGVVVVMLARVDRHRFHIV